MGNFNVQYENYYNKMLKKRNVKPVSKSRYSSNRYNKSSMSYRRSNYNTYNSEYYGMHLVKQTIVALIIFITVCGLKAIPTKTTLKGYDYCKKVLIEYDMSYLYEEFSMEKIRSYQDKIIEKIEMVRCRVMNEKSIFDVLKQDFEQPIKGEITREYGEKILSNRGKIEKSRDVVITNFSTNEVNAAFDGKVKEVGESNEKGRYVIINHGSGIETCYSNLEKICVEEKENVSKNTQIGLCRKSVDRNVYELGFELLYMGEYKDPDEYISFKKLS